MIKKLKLFGANELARESVNLARNIGNQDKRVQIYLLSEMAAIEEHRNVTRLNDFLLAIAGKGLRSNAVHNFVQVFCNIELQDKKKAWNRVENPYRMKAKRDKFAVRLVEKGKVVEHSFRDFDGLLHFAATVPWTKFKMERPATDFSLDSRAKSFLTAAFKAGISFEEIEAAVESVKAQAMADANAAIARAKKKAEMTVKNQEKTEANV